MSMPSDNATTMRAAVFDQYGPPEVLRLSDVPKPIPKPDEILIRVIAAAVNRTDCGFRKADPWIVRLFAGLVRPKIAILGSELAGEVEAVGANVTRFRVGDQICGLVGERFGAHAEYVCVAERATLVRTPAGLSPEQAAGAWEGPWLGLNCLRAAGIRERIELLVYGASGSIGSSAVQLAKHFGARVTAVCGTKNLDLLRSLGADDVVDYTATDFTQIDRSFDAVVDAVGKSTFGACQRLLKPGGIYVCTELGPFWQVPALHAFTRLTGGKQVRLAIPDEKRKQEDVELIAKLIDAGKFRPLIDRTYDFVDIVEAYLYVET
jgi:NADPH:quinone reductase-like Zn-dependent oxidoreductase